MVRPPAVGAGAEGDRPVVGEVGQRAAPVAHAVAEGAAAGVRDLAGQHVEALEVGAWPSSTSSNVHAPRSWSGVIGKCGGPIHVDRTSSGRRPCAGHQQAHLGVGPVAGREERQALRVVPVQVAQQDRAAERLAHRAARQPAQAGAGVEHQRRRLGVVVGDGHARGVAADGPRTRDRPRASSRGRRTGGRAFSPVSALPGDDRRPASASCSGSIWSAAATATRQARDRPQAWRCGGRLRARPARRAPRRGRSRRGPRRRPPPSATPSSRTNSSARCRPARRASCRPSAS